MTADGDGSKTANKKMLGKILLKQKLVSKDELDSLLEKQKEEPSRRLASTALDSGAVSSTDLLKALSEQHGLPAIDLVQVVVPLANLDLIPNDIAVRHLILPILVRDDRIFLAMADPTDRRVIDEIEFVTGRRIFPYVALHRSIKVVIDDCYAQKERGDTHYVGQEVPDEYLESMGVERNESRPGLITPDMVVESDRPLSNAPHDAELDVAFVDDVQPRKTEPPAREAPCVLVVDDEEDIRRLLERVLTQRGYEVVEADNGNAALDAVREHAPDVILLDAMLPGVHGFEICKRLHGSQRYGHVPIIMLSAIYRGWRMAADLKRSFGVKTFIEKPFKIADVLAAVEQALNGDPSVVVEEDLSSEAGAAIDRAIDIYQGGDVPGAIEILRAGIAVDPLCFELHYHLGLLFGRNDDVFDAINALEMAIELSPKNFAALKNLAVVYQRAGFRHKAIEAWERALTIAPDDETRKTIKEHLMGLL